MNRQIRVTKFIGTANALLLVGQSKFNP